MSKTTDIKKKVQTKINKEEYHSFTNKTGHQYAPHYLSYFSISKNKFSYGK